MSLVLVLAAETRDGLQEKGATRDTSKYVTEPLRLKTRSIRACSVCPLTTRVSAGTSCSRNTLAPLVIEGRLQGISPQLHACDQHLHRTDSRSSDAVAGPLVCCRSRPLHFCLGKTVLHLQHWGGRWVREHLLATETRKQRSSASYASLLGCMRCAPMMCEVDCDRRMACSVGVSVRLL